MTISDRYCFIDFETYSAIDLRKTGTYVYAEDETTDIWCCSYAFGEGPIKTWEPSGDWPDIPDDLAHHIKSGGILVAHNAAFERVIIDLLASKKHGWPRPKKSQWRCTMVMALAMALPGALENLSYALGIGEKDMEGHRLMLRMCRPRKINPDGSIVWWNVREKIDRLIQYCEHDVHQEREAFRKLLPLPDAEQKLWELDQEINDRGILVDEMLCRKARAIVSEQQNKLHAAMNIVTGGAVQSTTSVEGLKQWLGTKGLEVTSLKKEALNELLAESNFLDDDVQKALEIRAEASKASVAKIDALLRGRSRNGRACGLLQFDAASTGRWAGRRFQPQNLKRPDEETDIDGAIAAILKGANAAEIEAKFGPPLSIVGDCIRGMVRAPEGKNLLFGDFVSVEAVVLAWLAGETWKLEAFKAYRRGEAPDLYVQGYCKAFGVPLFDKKDPRRQFGKTMELASGYEGGHGAYIKMGAKGKKLLALTDLVYSTAPFEEWDAASEKFEPGNRHGLKHDPWVALRITIDRWRAAHSRIKQFWYDVSDLLVQAVKNPGKQFELGGGKRPMLKARKAGGYLFLRLPSGRCLCYPGARIEVGSFGREQVVYRGQNAYTRQWGDVWLYGGMITENIVQAVSRDFLAAAMVRLEAAGYPIILHVHDEAGTEIVGGTDEDLLRFVAIMEELMSWGEGCPIAVDGWLAKRYRK